MTNPIGNNPAGTGRAQNDGDVQNARGNRRNDRQRVGGQNRNIGGMLGAAARTVLNIFRTNNANNNQPGRLTEAHRREAHIPVRNVPANNNQPGRLTEAHRGEVNLTFRDLPDRNNGNNLARNLDRIRQDARIPQLEGLTEAPRGERYRSLRNSHEFPQRLEDIREQGAMMDIESFLDASFGSDEWEVDSEELDLASLAPEPEGDRERGALLRRPMRTQVRNRDQDQETYTIKARVSEADRELKTANLDAKKLIEVLQTVLKDLGEDDRIPQETLTSVERVLDFIDTEKGKALVPWMNEVCAVNFEGCVNQPVSALAKIMGGLRIVEGENLQEKINLSDQFIVNQIVSYHVMLNPTGRMFEAEAANILFSKVYSALRERELITQWEGVHTKFENEAGAEDYANSHLDKILEDVIGQLKLEESSEEQFNAKKALVVGPQFDVEWFSITFADNQVKKEKAAAKLFEFTKKIDLLIEKNAVNQGVLNSKEESKINRDDNLLEQLYQLKNVVQFDSEQFDQDEERWQIMRIVDDVIKYYFPVVKHDFQVDDLASGLDENQRQNELEWVIARYQHDLKSGTINIMDNKKNVEEARW